ncbi:MAG: P-type DNA transfer protein VirB5 [Rhodocyclales bacterium]|nr:P-type DNA transfer protein VirB5 [Rhodocyclales bacterium]
MFKHLVKLALVVCVWVTPQAARAGIPVIDVASLMQAVAQVSALMDQLQAVQDQLSTLKDTYAQAQQQVQAIKGARNLGQILNNPALQNYIPKDARQVLTGIQQGGYQGLSSSAKVLRDAATAYNCENIADTAERIRCESELNKPYQYLAYFQDALKPAANRTEQINQLLQQAGGTQDAKEIAEIQARIAGESALLQHEISQINLMRNMAEADAKVAEARAKELQRARAARTGTMGGITTGGL